MLQLTFATVENRSKVRHNVYQQPTKNNCGAKVLSKTKLYGFPVGLLSVLLRNASSSRLRSEKLDPLLIMK